MVVYDLGPRDVSDGARASRRAWLGRLEECRDLIPVAKVTSEGSLRPKTASIF